MSAKLEISEVEPRTVLLTFDDGPSIEQTPFLLDILARHDVKALFFLLGKRLLQPEAIEIASRAVREGHVLGNHSFSHPDMRTLDRPAIVSELTRTHHLISQCHYNCKLFRPPFGWSSPEVLNVAEEMGYRMVKWNVDTYDSVLRSGKLWVDHTIQKISGFAESTVLMHDIHEPTVAAVEELIQKINAIPGSRFISFA